MVDLLEKVAEKLLHTEGQELEGRLGGLLSATLSDAECASLVDANQCKATRYERFISADTRCTLDVGHEGPHDDGAVTWTDAPPAPDAALPVRIPSLEHLSNEELQALRSRGASLLRDARRKANAAIGKVNALKPLWMKSLGLKSSASPTERTQVMDAFESGLLKHPEAFFAHAYANSLLTIDAACREEALRRSFVSPKKTRKR